MTACVLVIMKTVGGHCLRWGNEPQDDHVCLYLGDVCGRGSTQGFRGDCLGSHQHAGLTVAATIQLMAEETKQQDHELNAMVQNKPLQDV